MASDATAVSGGQDKPSDTTKSRKPKRFRFRLRTLLILVTLIAVGFGGYQAIVVPYLEQAKIRRMILDAGFACDSRPAPAWLTYFVGEEAACTVTSVDLRYVRETTPHGLTHPRALIPEPQFVIDGYSKNILLTRISDLYADEDLLRQVGRLTDLEELNAVGQNITDEIVASWSSLKKLKSLNLAETLIEDPSQWPDFPLTTLDVSDTMLRDKQIAQLTRYASLRELNLSLTPVSDDGLRQLRSL